MNRAYRTANLLRDTLHVRDVMSPNQVNRACDVFGLPVRRAGFDRVLGLLIHGQDGLSDVALLKDGMAPYTAALVLAHELGHYALGHEGNHFFTPQSWTAMALRENRYEREAFAFAGALIAGPPLGPAFDQHIQEAQDEGYPGELLVCSLTALACIDDVRGRIVA